ncbi:MAG: amidohydrolase family protein [Rectinemataceae bacterium]|nr:amidohydrolase family protein [Rectinemataceae bacterium]
MEKNDRKLIVNALVVTKDSQNRIFRNGVIYIEGNTIKEIGPATEVDAGKYSGGAEVIDASGKIVAPGFISLHSHLYSAVVRSIPFSGFDNADFSFISWMERFWYPMLEDKVTQNQMYIGSLANMLGNIRSGITTTTDTAEGSYALPGAMDHVLRAADESGMRCVLSFETTGRISPENQALGLQENLNLVNKLKSRKGRVSARIGIHTTFSCPTELLVEARKQANELGCGLMMHMADDRWHNFDATRKYGKRPTRYLEDIGFLGPDLLLFHCAYMDVWKDPEIFKAHGVKIAHNAESNAIFGFWPDMIPFIKAGVCVGLGTDGQTHSMFEIMRTSQMIHRIKYEDLELLPDGQVLTMATTKGAEALLMEKEIGSLETGKKADLIMLKDRSAVPIFEKNVENYIISTCERSDVDTVMIDGNVLLKNGEFVSIDEKAVYEKSKEEAVDLWRRNNWPLP